MEGIRKASLCSIVMVIGLVLSIYSLVQVEALIIEGWQQDNNATGGCTGRLLE